MNLVRWLLCAVSVGAILAMTPAPTHAQNFHGYPCTEDCLGHEAGYKWAEKHDIEDPGDCGGNSNSFIEGCRAYATEHQEDLQRNNADNPDAEDDADNPDAEDDVDNPDADDDTDNPGDGASDR